MAIIDARYKDIRKKGIFLKTKQNKSKQIKQRKEKKTKENKRKENKNKNKTKQNKTKQNKNKIAFTHKQPEMLSFNKWLAVRHGQLLAIKIKLFRLFIFVPPLLHCRVNYVVRCYQWIRPSSWLTRQWSS